MINQLRLVVCPIFCRCFLHPSWCRILVINSSERSIPYNQVTHWLFSAQRKNEISCTICSSLPSELYTLTTTCLLSDMPPSWLDMTSFCPGKWWKMWLNNLRIHYDYLRDGLKRPLSTKIMCMFTPQKKGMPQNLPPIWAFPFYQVTPKCLPTCGDCISLAGLLALRLVNLMHLLVTWRWKITWLWSIWSNRFRFTLPETNRSQLYQNILHMLMENSSSWNGACRSTTNSSHLNKNWRLEDDPFLFRRPIFRDYLSFRECIVTWSLCWADLFWFQKTKTLVTFPTVRGGKPWLQVWYDMNHHDHPHKTLHSSTPPH